MTRQEAFPRRVRSFSSTNPHREPSELRTRLQLGVSGALPQRHPLTDGREALLELDRLTDGDTVDVDLQSLAPGTTLEIGTAALEITKDCEPCAFIDTLRPGLRAKMAGRRGMLARVVRSGAMKVGDGVVVGPPRL